MEGFKLFSMKFGPGGNADEQKLAIHELMTKIGKHDILFLQDFPWTTPHGECMIRMIILRGRVSRQLLRALVLPTGDIVSLEIVLRAKSTGNRSASGERPSSLTVLQCTFDVTSLAAQMQSTTAAACCMDPRILGQLARLVKV